MNEFMTDLKTGLFQLLSVARVQKRNPERSRPLFVYLVESAGVDHPLPFQLECGQKLHCNEALARRYRFTSIFPYCCSLGECFPYQQAHPEHYLAVVRKITL